MKLFTFLTFTLASICVFGQEALMDSIKIVQVHNRPIEAKSFCTQEFWDSEDDGGLFVFKQLCKIASKAELKISDTKSASNRTVFVIDILSNNEKVDEVYMFTIKKKDKWLIDGFNETEVMIDYFLEEKCTASFSLSSLPKDKPLQRIGEKMLNYRGNPTGLETYLDSIFSNRTSYRSIVEIADLKYSTVLLSEVRYSKKLDRGFLYFKKIDEKNEIEDLTIYLQQIGDNKYKLYHVSYVSAGLGSFFW